VLLPTVKVIVELPEPGAGMVLGLKLTVVPAGAPAADRPIGLLNPPLTAVVIVELPCVPCATLSDAGDAETVKLGEPDGWLTPR
jgi:hypothetical protein